MRIVITGASGNVGTALLLALGAQRDHDLVGVSRRSPPAAPPYSWASWSNIDVGAKDAAERLRVVFDGADVVVHLAWLIQPSRDRAKMRRTNRDGTAAVVDAAVAAGVSHLVHQSSVGAYSPGPGAGPSAAMPGLRAFVTEDWPTGGIATSSYSVDKAAAERIVDGAEDRIVVSRMRPALIFQDAAASEIKRYFLGPLVPERFVGPRLMRVAPLPDSLAFQAVHADDVAQAIRLVIDNRSQGAFNVAAPPLIDRAVLRETFGGIGPSLPPAALRAAASATWRLRLQPTEPGWIDLAAKVPMLDTARIRALGWEPKKPADQVLARFVRAIGRGSGRPGPLLGALHGDHPGPAGDS